MNLLWREIEDDWISIVFLLLLLLFILVKSRSRDNFWLELQQLLFAKQHQSHEKVTLNGKHLLMLFANVLILALVLGFLFQSYFANPLQSPPAILFLRIVLWIVIYYLFRYFVLWALGHLFDLGKSLKHFMNMTVFGIFVCAILLFSTGIAHHYIAEASHNYFLIVGTVFAAVSYVFLKLKSLWNLKKVIGFRKMHFILYLCTLEITPLLVVGRIVYLTI